MRKSIYLAAGILMASTASAGDKTYVCADALVGINITVKSLEARGTFVDKEVVAKFTVENKTPDEGVVRTYVDGVSKVTIKFKKDGKSTSLEATSPDLTWTLGCEKK